MVGPVLLACKRRGQLLEWAVIINDGWMTIDCGDVRLRVLGLVG